MTRIVAPFPSRRTRRSVARSLVGCALLLPVLARAGGDASHAQAQAHAPAAPPPAAAAKPRMNKPPPHRPAALPEKATEYYRAAWGVDSLRVSRVASGTLIRFTYRVTDAAAAASLADRKVTPELHAPRARAVLSVPVMDKVGPLRQMSTVVAGKEYWVAFSNKGNLVKAGDKVDVIIGHFHADGLTVE